MNNANIHDDSITQEAFRQQIENLPTEILDQPRFFPVAESKVPLISEWQKPENQHHAAQIQGLKGFDTCGHGRAVDYLLIDFDHVLDDAGNFNYPDAERWYNYISQSGDNIYCERSKSGDGLHFICRPTAGKFPKVTNSDKNRIYFDKETGAKIELFYLNAARYCLVTGNLFRCEPNATIPHDEDADEIFQQLLNTIAKNQPMQTTKAPAPSRNNSQNDYPDDTPEYNLFRAMRMLDVIPPAELGDADWLAVNSACKNENVPFEVVDAFNRRDPERYNEAENKARWDSLNDPSYDIETLHGIAKRFGGYSEADTRREWNELNGNVGRKHKRDRIAELVAQPQTEERDKEIIAAIRDACEWRYAKDANGTLKRVAIKPTSGNLELIFEEDPNLCGLVGYDQFQGVNVFLKRAPWHDEDRTGEQWHDTDSAQLRVYLRKNYAELEHKQRIDDTLIHFAHRNAFNAVKQFLENLPRWDGEDRAENLFVKFLHAEDSEYTRVVTMNFLFGALARVYHPGCDFQNCLVLQGAQRIGKSKLVKMLGGKESVNPNGQNWHVALKDSVDDAHAVDALLKGWIIEIEEFSAARKAEVNALKSFISANDDTRRFSYDRYATTRKRHVVFVVTCNDQQILRDPTGNARFIIIKCSQKKFDRVAGMTPEYIRQVWAEVLVKFNELFKDGFNEAKLILPLEIQMQAEAIAETFTQDDGLATEIQGFVDRKIPPQCVWLLLTRDERRRFIAEGSFRLLNAYEELKSRRKARGGKNIDSDIMQIQDICTGNVGTIRKESIKDSEATYFYGSEYRQHICAAEVFTECFGQDKRKSMHRINEILSQLDGWTAGTRLQKADPEYNDQTKPYYRDAANIPVDDDQPQADNFSGEPIDLDDIPFA